MKRTLIYLIYTLLIYAAIIALPLSFIYAIIFVLTALMLAMYDYITFDLKLGEYR